MKFISVSDKGGDTSTMPTPLLFGLLRALYYRGGMQHKWNELNGPDGVVRFVRAVRAEAFKRRTPIYPRQRAWMNALDPPNCRCGRRGARIIGSETFCMQCGPSKAAKARKKFWQSELERHAGAVVDGKQVHDEICRRQDAKRVNQRAMRGRLK